MKNILTAFFRYQFCTFSNAALRTDRKLISSQKAIHPISVSLLVHRHTIISQTYNITDTPIKNPYWQLSTSKMD